MRLIALAIVLLSSLVSISPASAQVCREGCRLWCNANRPTQSCYQACVGRPTCLTGGPDRMRGGQCVAWCKANKPGNYSCLGDCVARDQKYGSHR